MTLQEIKELVEGLTPYPTTYYQFPANTSQQPPFVCWQLSDDYFYADNRNYVGMPALTIELYTDTRDFAAEEAIEAMLGKQGLSWDKTDAYIDSEKMHMTTYTTDLVLT